MTVMAHGSRRSASVHIPHGAADIAAAAQLACLLEATAPKPGNVSPGRDFADMRYWDFLASAAAIGAPLAGAGTRSLGETIRLAVEATARWTRANTNLGIVLLLVPLARAAGQLDSDSISESDARLATLRAEVGRLLEATTIDDARNVYAAIRLANPGGLGTAGEQDVAHDPDVTLLETMRLAAHRDSIAREYATTFATTFDLGTPSLMRARADGLAWSDAIVETFLTLLAASPDTHIARRGGERLAASVSRLAEEALAAGGVRSEAGRHTVAAMDAALRDGRNLANPGTSADLTTAAVFIALMVGGWQSSPANSFVEGGQPDQEES